MEQRLKKYLQYIEKRISEIKNPEGDTYTYTFLEKEKAELLTQIAFFQHERLIHLIVTALFALMTIMTFVAVMLSFSIEALVLLALFFVLLIPYIRHYYILENGTQKLYGYYDQLKDLKKDEKKVVAFTFDDGPIEASEESSAMSILHTLKTYGQHATFFYVGQNINESNRQEIEFARSIGCEVGNHGYSHCHLNEISEEAIKEEIDKTDKLLSEIIGESIRLTRVTYLAYNEKVLKAIHTPVISCSVDSKDWDQASVEEIINTVLSADEKGELSGAIVLMHEPYYTTASAVQYLVPALIRKGYQIVSVSELAAYKKVNLKAHHMYTKL